MEGPKGLQLPEMVLVPFLRAECQKVIRRTLPTAAILNGHEGYHNAAI